MTVVGVPREIKSGECRVALTPDGARALRAVGARVLVERGAGAGSGFPDDEYAAAGATLVDRAALFADSELVVKVKEPVDDEPELLHAGQTLFCYLHLAAAPELARRLLGRRLVAVAYETVQVLDGALPLLSPMSAITGRLAVQVGASLLQSDHGGRGVLLGGVPGVAPGTVVVLGAGTVGSNAVQIAVGLGARVLVVDRNPSALARLDAIYHGRVETLVGSADAIGRAVSGADLVVGAVLVPGARAPVRDRRRGGRPGRLRGHHAPDDPCRARLRRGGRAPLRRDQHAGARPAHGHARAHQCHAALRPGARGRRHGACPAGRSRAGARPHDLGRSPGLRAHGGRARPARRRPRDCTGRRAAPRAQRVAGRGPARPPPPGPPRAALPYPRHAAR